MKPDGSEYWEMVLLYVDDALVISHRGQKVIQDEIGKYFKFKEESIGDPDIYLGGQLKNYVREAVKNVKSYNIAKKEGDHNKALFHSTVLPTRATAPFKTGYRPDADVSLELSAENTAYYQLLIDIL